MQKEIIIKWNEENSDDGGDEDEDNTTLAENDKTKGVQGVQNTKNDIHLPWE